MSGSEVGVEDRWVLAHRFRLPARDRLPLMQHDHLLTEVHDEAHVVLDQQEGHPLLVQLADVSAIFSSSAGLTPPAGSSSNTSSGAAIITAASSSSLRCP